MKDNSIPWRCRSCNDKYRNMLYENKSQEERDAFVATQTKRSKDYWSNRTIEEVKADSNRRKQLWADRIARNDLHIIDAMVVGRKEWYGNLSAEEEKLYWQLREGGRKEWWENLSKEEKDIHMKHPHKGWVKWYDSLSSEEKFKFMSPLWEGCQEYWDNLTPKEYKQRCRKARQWWDDLTPQQYDEWSNKKNIGLENYYNTIGIIPTKTESIFINDLNKYNVGYSYQYENKIIHPDFYKLFPYNPITNGNVEWQHWWDFIIYTKQGNILVDIDGSIHITDYERKRYNGFKYSNLENIKFKDSQRPYQTDGLDAYVIECYDDKLDNDNKVLDMQSNEYISFKQFKLILQWMNMSKKEQKRSIKEYYLS